MKKWVQRKSVLGKLMHITCTQLLLALLCVGASFAHDGTAQALLDQKVTIQAQATDIRTVLNQIEQQTDARFVFSSRLIKTNRKVTVSATNESLGAVLTRLLKPLQIDFEVVQRLIMLRRGDSVGLAEPPPAGTDDNALAALEKLISGTVSDETGESLPGVSVVLKGTQRGSTTDGAGKFRLAIPDEAATPVLVFSFVGYLPQEVVVGNQSVINVSLKADQKSLDEVVVVGYGTQSRRVVTGSVAKVDLGSLETTPNTNIAQALRGRVAGVQFTDNGRPGQGGNILVRGQRSITAGNAPLIILDGIFFEGSLADINPGDIESMEVLKDASATAIYGARAANGVILISSKKGTTEKPTIRLSTFYGVSGWSRKPKLLSPERYLQKVLDYRSQAGLASDPAKVADYLDATEKKNYLAGNVIDPWELVSQPGSIQNYDLSISGRSSRTNYFLSANINKDKGLIYNDKANRTSVRVNVENQITDWIRIGVNAQYAERDLSGQEGNLGAAFWTTPFVSPWLDEAKTDPNPFPTEDNLAGAVLFNAIINQNEERQRNLFANFFGVVDVPFVKGLSYRINYSPNYRWYELNNFSPVYQRNGINSTGSANRRTDVNRNWVLENILTYSRQFGQDHNLDLTLLYGRNQAYANSLVGSGVDFTGSSDANGWNNLALAKIQTTTSTASQVDAISSMARLNYRLKDRYLLTFTTRRDGNSVFGANNKFAIFPSAALGWIVSNEPFMKQVPLVNLLKLRASYGSVGNQAIQPYSTLVRQGQGLYVFGDGGTTSVGLFPANMANPNLRWETTTTTNLAVDFELLKGRVGGTIEWYNMDTKDLLLNRQLPTPTGFSSVLTNVGATNNRGLEVSLNTLNLKRDRFEWTSNIVFSSNRNRIVHIYNSDINGDGVEDNDIGNQWFVGQPIQVIYDYTFDGIYQANDQIPTGQKAGFVRVKDLNGDGKIDANDRSVIGNRDARFRWSFTNNLRMGQFNLMVMLNSMMGWQGVNLLGATSERVTVNDNGNFPSRVTNFQDLGWWTPDNKSNTRPSLVYSNPLATAAGLIESRDFVRLQEVSLSYDVPKPVLNKLKMASLRVFVSGRNLYTLTNWTGVDPETGYNNRFSIYPTPRTLSAGLNFSF